MGVSVTRAWLRLGHSRKDLPLALGESRRTDGDDRMPASDILRAVHTVSTPARSLRARRLNRS
jgi:hypothetical protein